MMLYIIVMGGDLLKNFDLQIHCAMGRQIWFRSHSITKAFSSQKKVWTLRETPKAWSLHIFSACEPSNCGVCSKAVAFVGTASQASSSAAKPVTRKSARRQAVALKTMRVRVSCYKAKLSLKVWFWTEKAAVCRNTVSTTPNRHRESWVRFKCSGGSASNQTILMQWPTKRASPVYISGGSNPLIASLTPATTPWPRSPEDGTWGQYDVKLVAATKRYHQTQDIYICRAKVAGDKVHTVTCQIKSIQYKVHFFWWGGEATKKRSSNSIYRPIHRSYSTSALFSTQFMVPQPRRGCLQSSHPYLKSLMFFEQWCSMYIFKIPGWKATVFIMGGFNESFHPPDMFWN